MNVQHAVDNGQVSLERAIQGLYCTARRAYSAPLFGAVPIVDRWTLPAPSGAGPMTVLRVSPRRPDVADLVRVVCDEGPSGGDALVWRWLSGHGLTADRLTLSVALTRPVRATFVLAFTLPRDRAELGALARCGCLGLTGAPRDAGPVATLTLPDVDELRRILALLDGEG